MNPEITVKVVLQPEQGAAVSMSPESVSLVGAPGRGGALPSPTLGIGAGQLSPAPVGTPPSPQSLGLIAGPSARPPMPQQQMAPFGKAAGAPPIPMALDQLMSKAQAAVKPPMPNDNVAAETKSKK